MTSICDYTLEGGAGSFLWQERVRCPGVQQRDLQAGQELLICNKTQKVD
jgi:hypothetical protein